MLFFRVFTAAVVLFAFASSAFMWYWVVDLWSRSLPGFFLILPMAAFMTGVAVFLIGERSRDLNELRESMEIE